MIHRAGVLCIALILISAPALAEEADAGTRFHDAYVLEVIDGEIAEAAKSYLALVGDEQVETRLRDEARFRFAICTVLLGRPDEGRMQLRAIVENEGAGASLRKRAAAYLESISALGVGTELERKLQSLIFDLGRADPNDEVPAYRDFEIIGAPAIPFLEKLLTHEDATLRRHAFRLLVRLGAEDLVARWNPDIDVSGQTFCAEFERYVTARPEELARFEAKLLALDDVTLDRNLSGLFPRPTWSLDFVRALAGRSEGLRRDAFIYLDRDGDEAARWAFAHEYILGDDDALRFHASRWAVGQQSGPPDDLADVLWLPVLRHVATLGGQWLPSKKGSGANLIAWAERLPTDRLLEALAELINLGEQAVATQRANPLGKHQPAGLVAYVLKERDLSPEQLDTYEERVRHWTIVIAPTLEGEMGHYDVNPVAKPLRDVVERLPADRAANLVGWTFRGPAHEHAEWFEDVVRIERPEDVPLLIEAVRRVHRDRQGILLHLLPKVNATWPSVEIAGAVVDALPTLLRLSTVEDLGDRRPGRRGFWAGMFQLTGRVPDEDLARAVRGVFEVAVEEDEVAPKELFSSLVSFQAPTAALLRQRGTFYARMVLPALDALHDRLTPPLRRLAMDKALLPLRHRYGLAVRDRNAMATYVLDHLDELQPNDWHLLASRSDLFPLAKWLPAAPPEVLNRGTLMRFAFPKGGLDEAMKALTADPENLTDPVLAVVVAWASPEVGRPVIDRMLASDDPTLRHRALESLRDRTGYPASSAGLEAALAGLLASDDADLGDLAKVALLLAQVQPSEMLLPAAERLLMSDDPKSRLEGITLAKRLGREDLVPALARLLSSLDANLRDRAKAAIQAIQELKRLQEEAGQPR